MSLFFLFSKATMRNKKEKKFPTIWTLGGLMKSAGESVISIDGLRVPCRPIGPSWLSNRIKAAWLVFTGKADVVIWPEGQ
jgi:hypothetical protein